MGPVPETVAQVGRRAGFGVEVGAGEEHQRRHREGADTSATAASRFRTSTAWRCRRPATRFRDGLAAFVAERHQADPGGVRFADGRVHVGGGALLFDTVVKDAYMNRFPLSATGFYKTPKIVWDRLRGEGRPFFLLRLRSGG